ncbi:MAG: hypothetical protein ACRD11_11655, partial [Terriglobia bacterium]
PAAGFLKETTGGRDAAATESKPSKIVCFRTTTLESSSLGLKVPPRVKHFFGKSIQTNGEGGLPSL